MGIAQRRAAKALKRKAIVKAKQGADRASLSAPVGYRNFGSAVELPILKASEALIEIAAPLSENADDLEGYHKSLLMAMLAWNLSLLPVEARKEEMGLFFDTLYESGDDDGDRETLRSQFNQAITQLISRKMLFYPLDCRRLVDLDIIDTGDEYRVNVTSTLELPREATGRAALLDRPAS